MVTSLQRNGITFKPPTLNLYAKGPKLGIQYPTLPKFNSASEKDIRAFYGEQTVAEIFDAYADSLGQRFFAGNAKFGDPIEVRNDKNVMCERTPLVDCDWEQLAKDWEDMSVSVETKAILQAKIDAAVALMSRVMNGTAVDGDAPIPTERDAYKVYFNSIVTNICELTAQRDARTPKRNKEAVAA